MGQIPPTATETDVREVFSAFGEVVEVYVVRNRETGESKGFLNVYVT